jgi:hypothetical protein
VPSLEDSARCFFTTAKKTGLALRLDDTHRALLASYLLNLWRGPEAVRKLIVADVRLWIELGAPERAADGFLVLRQFLSDFPEARTEVRSRDPRKPVLSHVHDRRRRQQRSASCGRASSR